MPRHITPNAIDHEEAMDRIAQVLAAYNGSRDNLMQTYRRRRRLGNLSGSQVHRDYQTLTRNEKIVRAYERSILNIAESPPHCQNCKRFQTATETLVHADNHINPYMLSLRSISSDALSSGRRTYKFCKKQTEPVTQYTLCRQCYEHTCNRDNKVSKHFKNTWPAFMWSILSSQAVHAVYGASIWKIVPKLWRNWWIHIVRARFPSVYGHVSLDHPIPYFQDCTNSMLDFTFNIDPTKHKERGLQKLRDACNKYLLPTISCPYGCTEFLHKCNHLSLDLVLQRYLQKVRIMLPSDRKARVQTLMGTRDDYFREDGDNDCLLLNPEWSVMPSVAFDNDGCPNILCCRHHNARTKGFMVHISRHPGHNLPSIIPDQLAHACINPRTVTQLRRNYGSNSYQMFRQDGSFNGIDTCSSTSFGNFDFCSFLSAENEAICIKNRPDTNALLSTLAEKGVISHHTAEGRRQSAKQFAEISINTSGATYVLFHASMEFLKLQSTENLVTLRNDTRSDTRNLIFDLKVKRPWPTILFPCQSMSPHGCSPPMLPQLGSMTKSSYQHDFEVERLWFLLALAGQVEPIWYNLTNYDVYKTSEWIGWFVFFASVELFGKRTNTCRVRGSNPFVTYVYSNYEKLMEKLRTIISTEISAVQLIGTLPGVCSIEYTSETNNFLTVEEAFDSATIDSHCSIFLVENYLHYESDVLPQMIPHGEDTFHLRLCACSTTYSRDHGRQNGHQKFIFESYMRHGNQTDTHHSKWWNQKRGELPIQQDFLHLDNTVPYVLCYVKGTFCNLTAAGMEMMNYIGGQSHYHCAVHKLPVITSSIRKRRCTVGNCSRKEYFVCPNHECNLIVCKQCVDTAPENEVTYGVIGNTSHSITSIPDMQDVCNEASMMCDSTSNSNEMEYEIDDYLSESTIENENEFLEMLNDFVTTDNDVELTVNDNPITDIHETTIPTTDSGDIPYHVYENNEYEGQFGKITISGHVLMNQCGSLLTRNNHQIKGSSRHHNLLQQICATNIGTSVPLLQPEAMLFPSIFPVMVPKNNVLLGAIPSSFLCESISMYGYQSLPAHVRTRLTSPMSKSSTDPRYIAFCYDMLTNLSATHLDVRIAMNRGLTAADDKSGGLGVRGGNESSSSEFLGTIDSSKCVKNLCAAQRYHPQDFFVTITCNQLRHFGTKIVKEWIDSSNWCSHFPNYSNLSSIEHREISLSLSQAASGILLRNWQEVCNLLITYLRHSPCSPYKKVNSIFSRNEYQKDTGNLSHIHLILQVDWSNLSPNEKEFMDDLIRGDIMSIVKSHEITELINEGLLESMEDITDVYNDATTFLAHRCTERCLERVGPNEFRCRKPNYGRMTEDNTRNCFLPLPNDLPAECLNRLVRIGLAITDGDASPTKPFFKHKFFTPSRHIPPINHNSDSNISPVDAKLFILCRSMQNVQKIRGCGGCNKYICKYIAKIDEQNYVVVSVYNNSNGRLVTKSNFLHNTKISRSSHNENEVRKASREYSKPQGRSISLMEMLHVMLKYPEVITDLHFVNIPTVPLELRSRVGLSVSNPNADDAVLVPEVVQTRIDKFPNESYRRHSDMEVMMINDLRLSQTKVDRITQFSLRPPELRDVIDSPGIYFRWFTICESGKPMSGEKLISAIKPDLYQSQLIDGFGYVVKLRQVAFHEVQCLINRLPHTGNEICPGISEMISYFQKIFEVYDSEPSENSSRESLFTHFNENIIDHNYSGHLPVPVYSYTRPTSVHKFILHVLLSMGRFRTEPELTMHSSIRKCFRYAKLIGPSDDEDSLQTYSDSLLFRFIVEQLCYFSNSRRVLSEWISVIGDLFDSAIIKDEILVTDMPSVQLSTLLRKNDDEISESRLFRRKQILSAAFEEMGTTVRNQLPPFDDLLHCSKENPVVWDPIVSFRKSPSQSAESYQEQKLAIEVACAAIKKYTDVSIAASQTKNVGIRGFPGGGKTWCSLYCIIYAVSCGLECLTTAMMARRATCLGGVHWHRFFGLPIDSKLTPQRIAELALAKIETKPVLKNCIESLDVIFADELGQLSSEFVAAINIILCTIRGTGQMFGGVLLIGSLDHTQIQPWEGKPFLSSPLLIPTFVMVKLSHSVRTSHAASFEMQDIARQPVHVSRNSIGTTNDLVRRFLDLASNNFTFVERWDDPIITSSTFRVYSKKVPVAEAAKLFVQKVRNEFVHAPSHLIVIKAMDMFRLNGSRQDFRAGGAEVSKAINLKTKLSPEICFFRGAVFECTFNCPDGTFMNSDPVVMLDLPSIDDIRRWRKVTVLKFPPGWKDFDLNYSMEKSFFLNNGFVEIGIPVAPMYTLALPNSMQAKRKQYGIRHRITGTIHSAMGDTFESMASEISNADPNFGLWDRGQLVVIISRTRLPSKTIFVGSKERTLATLRRVILRKTQWTDHISDILDTITVNTAQVNPPVLTLRNFPFRIRDASLPCDNSGIVYMLNSLRRRTFTYIGKTNNPRRRLKNHNCGYGSSSTEPAHLRPFAVMAYIAGFEGNNELMLAAENMWKYVRDDQIRNGDFCVKSWARGGQRVIQNSNLREQYQLSNYSLRLVLLFHDD